MIDRRGFMKGAAALAASGFASAQDSSTLVVRNAAHVVTMDPKLGNLADADVQIRDGRIVAIGRNLAAVSGQVIDARDMIVMPGLIDTHTHMWNCLWRTLDTPYIYGHSNLGPQYRPEDSYNAVRLCAAEFLFGGITTVHAWEHNVRSPAHADAELKALTDMGMRTHYSYGYYHHLPADQPMNLEDILRVRRQWQGETVTVGYASRPDTSDGSPQTQWPTATPAVRKLEWEFARRERLPITHHVTTPASKPEAYYEVAGPDVLLIHGYHWGLDVWQRLAKLGARVSLSPYSAANYRTPVPFRELFQAGMPVGLSFDHMNRTGNADFFRMLVLASNIEHLRTGTGLTAHRALELVTIDGARALGLGDITGSLTPGKRADLIMIRTDELNMTPMVSPERAVVNSARPENVDTVMVNGRVVKSRGGLTVADARRVGEDAARSLKAILQRAG